MSALEGVRVLDLSRYLPGPYCTLMLADHGADVIRVEQPHEVLKRRQTWGQADFSDEELERWKACEIAARNKRSMLLDLHSPVAPEILRRLIERADVLVSDYRPGVLDQAGYGYEDVRRSNPGIIYCAVSLCGQTGPYRDVPGHDPVSLALAGVLSRFHRDRETPDPIGVPVSDINSALHAVVGVLLALRVREQTGKGQLVDVAMSDTAFAFVTPAISRLVASGREPIKGVYMANNGVWRTRDGRYICTTDMEPRYWKVFCELVGRPDWKPRIHQRGEIDDELRALFLTKDRDEWVSLFRKAGTQAAPVLSLSEAVADQHARERNVIVEVEDAKGRPVIQVGPLIKMSETPGQVRQLAHMPGQDTRAILEEVGFDKARTEELLAEISAGCDARLRRYL